MKYLKVVLIVLAIPVVFAAVGYYLLRNTTVVEQLSGSTSTFQLLPITVTDPESSMNGVCKKFVDGTGMACINVSEAWCEKRGGAYESCGSTCLFDEQAGACPTVCSQNCIIRK